jgi:hypothetical protein
MSTFLPPHKKSFSFFAIFSKKSLQIRHFPMSIGCLQECVSVKPNFCNGVYGLYIAPCSIQCSTHLYSRSTQCAELGRKAWGFLALLNCAMAMEAAITIITFFLKETKNEN